MLLLIQYPRYPLRRLLRIGLLVLIILCGAIWLVSMVHRPRPLLSNPHSLPDPWLGTTISGPQRLVIVLPADHSSHELCKVLSSIIALGYPAPIIVNWNATLGVEAGDIGASQLGKITGTLNFLDWATDGRASQGFRLDDGDLVLMLDAYDVWLQLPPSVLLRRYYTGIERANERFRREHHSDGGGLLEQTIVVSAQKGCVAPRDSVSNLHCKDVPESTLPTSIYGPLTDFEFAGWKYVRPRYLNSGSLMGPVGDMKKYFRRVMDKMDQHLAYLGPDQELNADQGIFAEVFAEQELWRRGLSRERDSALESAEHTAVADEEKLFEYHVGLDYTQELFYPTCYSEQDGHFARLSDLAEMRRISSNLGVSVLRIEELPPTIRQAEIPFAKLANGPHMRSNWEDLPLYMDFWTTTIPVAIHHNAWRHGLKSRRVDWWDQMWYFPHLRSLLEFHLQRTNTLPLVELPSGNESFQVTAYPTANAPITPWLFVANGSSDFEIHRVADWSIVCKGSDVETETTRPWHSEIFRDGAGALSRVWA